MNNRSTTNFILILIAAMVFITMPFILDIQYRTEQILLNMAESKSEETVTVNTDSNRYVLVQREYKCRVYDGNVGIATIAYKVPEGTSASPLDIGHCSVSLQPNELMALKERNKRQEMEEAQEAITRAQQEAELNAYKTKNDELLGELERYKDQSRKFAEILRGANQ